MGVVKLEMHWVEIFSKMLFSIDANERDQQLALQLKHIAGPSSIFKYRKIDIDSIINLEEDSVWLTSPDKVNDPYDCGHSIDYDALFDEISKKIPQQIEKLPLETQELLRTVVKSDHSNKGINVNLHNLPAEVVDDWKRLHSAMLQLIKDDLIANDKTKNRFKLCSFSERIDSVVMWSHYADAHKGFCIEYDIKNLPYEDERPLNLYPVIYSDEVFDATTSISRGINNQEFNLFHLFLSGLVKSKDWAYEKEWRLLFNNKTMVDDQPYFMGKPKAVYLGINIDPRHEKMITEICTRKQVSVKKMRKVKNRFMLESES